MKPYLNFRTSQETMDAIVAIGDAENLTNADVARQMAMYGLKRYQAGDFQLIKRTNQGNEEVDKRSSRECGRKISKQRAGRPIKSVGDSNETSHPSAPDRLLDKPAGAISND